MRQNAGSRRDALLLLAVLCIATPIGAEAPAGNRREGSLAAPSQGPSDGGEAELGTRPATPPPAIPRRLQGLEAGSAPAQPGDRRQPGASVVPKPDLAYPGAHGARQANLVVELIVPVSQPEGLPGTGFCAEAPPSGGPSQQVRFRARNAGTEASEPSKTAVHWTGPNGFAWMNLVDTPAVQPGGASNTYVNLPPGCFGLAAHGSCQFLVELDRTDAVPETSEADNHQSGVCIKPGT